MYEVTVRVPASTSNLGPGFDCLGLALRLYNYVTVRRGHAKTPLPIASDAADLFFKRSGAKKFQLSCTIGGDVPASRGLGSSASVRTGVLHGLNELAGRVLSREQIFQLCAELERHPDNAAPAAFGGFNVVRAAGRQRFPVSSELQIVLLIPAFEVRTADARALLPDRLRRLDAVESCGNACAIAAAFASQSYGHLRGAFTDKFHQPFRKTLVPFFDDVVGAAEDAGALGAFLSGSGSTIGAVTLRHMKQVADAMAAAAQNSARVIITRADNRGARVVSRARQSAANLHEPAR
ncbi:MAG: homoserine kinase [Chthoniobacterales bacterium]|nr:homoserine kinase [Chthoniobacterales bacterium]